MRSILGTSRNTYGNLRLAAVIHRQRSLNAAGAMVLLKQSRCHPDRRHHRRT